MLDSEQWKEECNEYNNGEKIKVSLHDDNSSWVIELFSYKIYIMPNILILKALKMFEGIHQKLFEHKLNHLAFSGSEQKFTKQKKKKNCSLNAWWFMIDGEKFD